jgi:hypothetical protein
MKKAAIEKPVRKIKKRRHLAPPMNHRKKLGPKDR